MLGFVILHYQPNASCVDEVITWPIWRSNICGPVCHHIFIVIDASKWNFWLVLWYRNDESFLLIRIQLDDMKIVKNYYLLTTWRSTFGYACDNASSDRKKKSSAGCEWFHHEMSIFTWTLFSIAAARNALSIMGQYLWNKQFFVAHLVQKLCDLTASWVCKW